MRTKEEEDWDCRQIDRFSIAGDEPYTPELTVVTYIPMK